MPVLMVAGAGDTLWAPVGACEALHRIVTAADRTFLVFGKAQGHTTDYGHVDLIVGRPAREEVWPRLVEWLDARSGTRGLTDAVPASRRGAPGLA
jgi:hypothetical protein